MSNKIKSIFSKDIGEAISNARRDEREKCNQEKIQALERQRQKIEGEWFLKLKEKEAEIESLLLRMRDLADKEKKVNEERQAIREVSIIQRRIASDLVFVAQKKHEDDTKVLQEFLKIQTDIDNSEKKLIGINES